MSEPRKTYLEDRADMEEIYREAEHKERYDALLGFMAEFGLTYTLEFISDPNRDKSPWTTIKGLQKVGEAEGKRSLRHPSTAAMEAEQLMEKYILG